MWDLRSELTDEVFTPIAYKALSYLVRDSGFKDFLISLLLADLSLNDAKNACLIYQRALERSFDEFLVDVNCETPDAWKAPVYDPSSPVVTGTPETNDDDDSGGKSGLFGCGVLGGLTVAGASIGWLLIMFFFPFLVCLISLTQRTRKKYAKEKI